MATVKGDVHDIGKNIVGVVLQCNNFDVVDLGVMVPAKKILDTAIERNADIVGLSGLITPSLEEMAHVALEMQRLGMRQPLLIGGATTSRVHTAVKIAPDYAGITVYVPDASRSVGVASNLLSDELKPAYVAEIADDYEKIRIQHANRKGPALISLAAARANAFRVDWAHYVPPRPELIGRREFRTPIWPNSRAISIGVLFSRRGNCPAPFRRFSRIRSSANPRARFTRKARRCWSASSTAAG